LEVVGVGTRTVVEISQPNTRSNIEVAKPQMFNREVEKVLGFLIAYRLYIKMRMREAKIEEQI